MIRTYLLNVEGEQRLEFDDSKTVRELIAYVFDRFDYYEPAGMDIVTVFQCHHSKSNNGWFTTDTSRTCAEEIEDPGELLCIAYHKPGAFYFAEGGWGHHMEELGNHPILPDPVTLYLRFEDFRNAVVINGHYCLNDVVRYLIRTSYLPADCSELLICPIGIGKVCPIPFSDPIMRVPLTEVDDMLDEYVEQQFPGHGPVYSKEIEIR